MSDQFLLFLLLVLPVLVVAVLTYLGILTVGIGTIVAALRSAHPLLKGTLLLIGILVILSPVLFHKGMDMRAQRQADQRQAYLAQLERTDLRGQRVAAFITVGNFGPDLTGLIQARYKLRTFPEVENERLAEAYRAYRRAELCRRRFGNEMMQGTRLPKCMALPDSVQIALNLREPLLVFADGSNTSMREDNILAGEMYEIRLITPEEDLLVAYYEERTVKETVSVFNPYASGRRNASVERPPTLKEFIEAAMEEAGR